MSQRPADHLVEIGVVGRPHGVRGAIRIYLHHPGSTVIEPGRALLLAFGAADPVEQRVAEVRAAPKHLIASFEQVTDRAAADGLKGARVLVPRSALPPLAAGEFYVDDLIGMEVYWGEELLGRIASSRAQGGVEVVRVVGGAEEIEVPLVEDYVEALDQVARRLEVREIEELPRTPLGGK